MVPPDGPLNIYITNIQTHFIEKYENSVEAFHRLAHRLIDSSSPRARRSEERYGYKSLPVILENYLSSIVQKISVSLDMSLLKLQHNCFELQTSSASVG